MPASASSSLQPQLDAVVAVVLAALGDAVAGVYLHGSAVLGFIRSRSDLDVLVVTHRATTRAERVVLTEGVLAISDHDDRPGFGRPVELTIVVGPDVNPWRYPPPIDYLYGEWLRADLEAGRLEPASRTSPDLATILTLVRSHGRAIVGPPPDALLAPVPPEDLRRAMSDELDPLLDELRPDTRNVVLTLARILVTVRTGEIHAKDAAADWVLARLPEEHRPVLARARAVYVDAEPERWDDLEDRLVPFANYLVSQIRGS